MGGRETKCASQERDERTRMFERTLWKGSDLSSGSNDTTLCVTPNRLLYSKVLTCRDRALDDLWSALLFYGNLILPLSRDLKPSEEQGTLGTQEWMNKLNPQPSSNIPSMFYFSQFLWFWYLRFRSWTWDAASNIIFCFITFFEKIKR